MCNSSKSCTGAVEDDDHSKRTATRLFRVVTITFLFQSPTGIHSGICLRSKLDSEFRCFSGGSDLKTLTSKNQNSVWDSLSNSLGFVYCVLPYCIIKPRFICRMTLNTHYQYLSLSMYSKGYKR